MKKLFPLVVLALLLGTSLYIPKIAHAQTTGYTVTEAWDASCNGSVSDGSQSGQAIYDGLASGDTVNLNIVNSSSTQNLQFSVSNEGSATANFSLAPNGTIAKSYTVAQSLDLFVQSSNCSATANFSHLYFLAGNGTLTCTISNNKVWNLAGTFNDVVNTTSLYRGSTYVQHYSERNNTATVDGTQVSAQSTAQTYYFYNGSDSSAPLISQVTCPATTAATASTPATTTTTTPSTTTTSTTTPTAAATPTTSAPKKTTNPEFSALDTSARRPAFKPHGGVWIVILIIDGLLGLLTIVSTWKAFQKAGRRGWEAIIPGYNAWVILELGGKPGWWAILMFIPIIDIVALVMYVLAEIELAKRFGKSALFGFFGLFMFGFIGWTILGFSEAKYTVPSANAEADNPVLGTS